MPTARPARPSPPTYWRGRAGTKRRSALDCSSVLLRHTCRSARATCPVAIEAGTAQYQFSDFERRLPMALVALLFAAAVVGVARLRGLVSLLGLGFAGFILVKFMFPALISGSNPTAVGLVGHHVRRALHDPRVQRTDNHRAPWHAFRPHPDRRPGLRG